MGLIKLQRPPQDQSPVPFQAPLPLSIPFPGTWWRRSVLFLRAAGLLGLTSLKAKDNIQYVFLGGGQAVEKETSSFIHSFNQSFTEHFLSVHCLL